MFKQSVMFFFVYYVENTLVKVFVIFLRFFFFWKVLFFVHAQFFFRGLIFDFFLGSLFSLVKRKPNSTIDQLKCKRYEKRGRILIPRVEFNLQISQWNKNN